MRALAFPLLLGLCATAAAAQSPQTVATVWDRFDEVCGRAMTDPQGFADTLGDHWPAETFGVVTSEDGRMYKINIAEDHLFFTFGIVVVDDRRELSCSTTYNGAGFGAADANAATYEAEMRRRYPDAIVSGGRFPEQYRQYDGSQGNQILLNTEDFQYYSVDSFPVPDAVLFTQIIGDYIAMSVSVVERQGV